MSRERYVVAGEVLTAPVDRFDRRGVPTTTLIVGASVECHRIVCIVNATDHDHRRALGAVTVGQRVTVAGDGQVRKVTKRTDPRFALAVRELISIQPAARQTAAAL